MLSYLHANHHSASSCSSPTSPPPLASYTDISNQVRTLQHLADSLFQLGRTEEALNAYTSIIRFYGNLTGFAVERGLVREVREGRVGCLVKLGMMDEVEREMAVLMEMTSLSESSSSPRAEDTTTTTSSRSRFSSALRRFATSGHFGHTSSH